MAARVLPRAVGGTRHGELPVVCDASSCTEGLRQMLESELRRGHFTRSAIVDAVEFVAEQPAAPADRSDRKLRDGAAPDLLVHPDGH